MMDALLTMQMAADEAGVTKNTLVHASKDGRLATFKHGWHRYTYRSDLLEYLRSRSLSNAEFLTEWEHFHHRMGMSISATVSLLAERYGLVEETVRQRAKLLTEGIAA